MFFERTLLAIQRHWLYINNGIFMPNHNGFSLAEVLMALCIFSFSCLALFKHQWQLTKGLQYQKKHLLAQEVFDDVSEFNIANLPIASQLHYKINNKLHGSLTNTINNNKIYTSLKFNNFDGYKQSKQILRRQL